MQMKHLIIVLLLLQFSCSPIVKFSVKNDSQADKYHQLVNLDFKEAAQLEKFKEFGIYCQGKEIQKQIYNRGLNNIFVYFIDDFKAGESKQYTVKESKSSLKSQYFTNIRFSPYKSPEIDLNYAKRLTTNDTIKAADLYQMEGPAWENNKVAFRNYFDNRNGFDIFGKQTNSMVLDSVGIAGTNYHELSDWGMDILKVGNSLGAGSLAIQIGDTIYPVRNVEEAYFQKMIEGPFLASFNLTYNNFRIKNRIYNITHTIEIMAEKYYFESIVTISGLMGDEKLVTGIVNLKSNKIFQFTKNDFIVHYTHYKQSENNDLLGLGIMLNKMDFEGLIDETVIAKDITDTYMISMKIKNNQPLRFRFYAGWERTDSHFESRDFFENMMQEDTDSTPLKIKFFNK